MQSELIEDTKAEFENVVGQDSLTRFDSPKPNNKRKNNRNNRTKKKSQTKKTMPKKMLVSTFLVSFMFLCHCDSKRVYDAL